MERVMKIRASLNVSELKCETSICNTFIWTKWRDNFTQNNENNKWMSAQHANGIWLKVRMEKKTTSKMASC